MATSAFPHRLFSLVVVIALLHPGAPCSAQSLFVAPGGNDAHPGTELLPWRTIQKACSSATPGSTVYIRQGVYNEKVTVTVSGTAVDGPVTFRNHGADTVILDGTGIPGQNLLYLAGRNRVVIAGLTLRNNNGVTDGSGVRIEGAADRIELRNLTIYNIRGENAMGITCYGTDATTPISNLVIDGNTIYDCDAAPSEAVALNGNVDGFVVTNNTVHDINNIGIVFIGGEGTCPVGSNDRARNGICRANHVYRARSNYGGGYAAGIYVDGGRKIVVENNVVHENDLGIEIGCENHGEVADSVVVRNNLVYNNDKRGISFGGYNYPSTGQVQFCRFSNNTLFMNDALGTGDGEIVVEYALHCVVENTIAVATGQNILLTSVVGSGAGNTFRTNLWQAPGGINSAVFAWGGTAYTGFAAYRTATGQDAGSAFGDPQLASPVLPSPDLHITAASPAVDAGGASFLPDSSERDMDGEARIIGLRADAGADELAAPPNSPPLLSPEHDATGLPPQVSFSWLPVPLASRYHLQIAADSGCTLLLMEDSLIGAPPVLSGPFAPSAVAYWRLRAANSVGISLWSASRRFATADFESLACSVGEGWNLLSLPLQVFDPLRSALFPGAASAAFVFDSAAGYRACDTLLHGPGFWLKFPAEADLVVRGNARSADTLLLHRGWNIVGALSTPVATDSLIVRPPGILQSGFFSYEGAYVAADSLLPSRGYWVKTAEAGWLILDSPSGSAGRSMEGGR